MIEIIWTMGDGIRAGTLTLGARANNRGRSLAQSPRLPRDFLKNHGESWSNSRSNILEAPKAGNMIARGKRKRGGSEARRPWNKEKKRP